MDKKYTLPAIQISVWLCFLFYPLLFHIMPFNDGRTIGILLFLFTLALIFCYANSKIMIPVLLAKRHFFSYFVCILISILVISYASGYLQLFFNPGFENESNLFNTSFITAVMLSVFAWVISSGFKITAEWFRNQQLMKSAENERLQAQLNFLKSQINPHFLFNALNNIYALENKNSPDTGPAILKLSELTRYMLDETSSEFVSLQKELDYVQNYIELQKLGISKDVKIDLEIAGDANNLKIEPMLLLPLVENVFKHGVSYVNQSFIRIKIVIHNKQLELTTENKVSEKEKHDGFGLSNLKKRLELRYPGKYVFSVKKENGEFISYLKLYLK